MMGQVLITGGTGALGSAVTRRFLEDGHRVAITCRHQGETERLLDSLGPLRAQLLAIEADVTDEASVQHATAHVHDRLGPVQTLVHLVGAWHGGEPVQSHSLDSWRQMMELNLTSAFLCCRAVLPTMRQANWGRIVLVSSRTAHQGRTGQAAYAIAKEGVGILSEVIAEECRGTRVTANTIAPSVIDTPSNRRAMPNADVDAWVSPEDAACIIAFLASEEAGQLRGAWLSAFGSV
jgi:NAD(P)-dependent dehydrogenase (short-subunit alcohol dehydrogenase family)